MDNSTITDPFAGLTTSTGATPGPAPATDKQIAFMTKLLDEKEHGFDAEAIASMLTQSRRAVSQHIDFLMSRPRKATPTSSRGIVFPDGIYLRCGSYYRVYLTRETRQQVVGKLIITKDALRDERGHIIRDANGYAVQPAEAEWEYLGKGGLRLLNLEDKCSHEEASKFGALYGICCACAAHLNNPVSVYHGYGPTCADNNGWPRLTPGQLAKVYASRGLEVAK